MEWLMNLILKSPTLSLLYPTILSGVNFLGNLSAALSDGEIDAKEFHQLMSSASLIQVLVLTLVMIALHFNKKNNLDKDPKKKK